MKSLFLFVLTCFISLAWGQIPAPTFRWAVPISGALQLYDMKVTPAGDVYVFGYFKDYICFDTTWAHCQYSHGKEDYFLAKYNQEGELVWSDVIGSRGLDGISTARMTMDENNDLYLAFKMSGDTIWVNEQAYKPRGGSYAMCKFDKTGTLSWIERVRTIEGNIQFIIPKDDKLYICGQQMANMPFQNDTLPYQGQGNLQEYICILSQDRQIVQFAAFQEADTSSNVLETFTNFLTLSNGNLLVAGRFETSLSVPPLLFEENNFPGGATYMMLLDPELKPIWGEVYSSGGNLVNNFVFDKNNYYHNYALAPNDTLEVFGNVMVWDTMGLGEYAAIKAEFGKKPIWKKSEDEKGTKQIGQLRKGNFYGAEYTDKGNDTLYYYGNPIIRVDSLRSSFAFRTDTNLQMVWTKHKFSYPENQSIDRSASIGYPDSIGYLYGSGYMKQFAIYLDSILVKPLFVTMGLYGEQFICSTTRDSFPPPPPVDTLPPSGTVYPNPFGDVVNLVNEFQAGAITFEVIDTKGSLVWQKTLEIPKGRQLFTFDLSRLASGIYFLSVKQSNKQAFYKIIKTP